MMHLAHTRAKAAQSGCTLLRKSFATQEKEAERTTAAVRLSQNLLYVDNCSLSHFLVNSLLRKCFSRQVLRLMDSLNTSKERKPGRHAVLPDHCPSTSTHSWPHKYGMHPVTKFPVPPPPKAWAEIEAIISHKVTMRGMSARDALLPHLTPPIHAVPSTFGPQGDRCQLAPSPMGARFCAPELNTFIAKLFESVAAAAALQSDLPEVELSRYDLFHAHMFLAECFPRDDGRSLSTNANLDPTPASDPARIGSSVNASTDANIDPTHRSRGSHALTEAAGGKEHNLVTRELGLGLLFHCKEYPAFDEADFPYNLGFCQALVRLLTTICCGLSRVSYKLCTRKTWVAALRTLLTCVGIKLNMRRVYLFLPQDSFPTILRQTIS
ncbi:hypothetical protein DUNSADRAFT_18689 [Dunaliella salina]|uniref:Encoded protein n=1 Tax=Dunaliella salina TaxID=3046 RepID=A0ABQ7FZN8_DUNSA|nr:hypothetical protein DUNSADRAFT_18689 [Dunaliella salina]|eukprot:KAF5827818.1 hypothetical protein DUNSADRAFT_18689 [Dunaliella salina]